MGSAPPRRRVLILFVLVSAGLLGLVMEGGARLAYAAREWLRAPTSAASGPPVSLTAKEVEAAGRALGLDPYEMADPVHPENWRLRPGYRATVREMLAQKRRLGRRLTVRYMEEMVPLLGIGPDEIAMEINPDGFRGPSLDPGHERYRILALGDSCTFGSPLSQRHGYPRVLERELRRHGFGVEVINAGVEGYAPANVLARLDEFRSLQPQMTTLYIGWNALFTERYLDEARGLRRHLASARLAAQAWGLLRARFVDPHGAAIAAYERPKHPDRAAPELQLLDDYTPSFLPDVVRIVEEVRSAGSEVVILTLPGLYSVDREPSSRALEIGHLPPFTDNPFVLARMAERYNNALRTLARRRNLPLVDLDRWASETLTPADAHFVDSVHLDDLSQARLGIYLAEQIAPLLRSSADPVD
jgi:lysophospholipase L1-like esterase